MAKNDEKANLKRLAIVNDDLCRPTECSLECKKACPVNRIGKACIVIEKHARISEPLCIGCGACVKKCPFKAITIINLPSELSKDCTHRYGPNSFKLHRLPVPKLGKVLGLVGINGIGKSTALSILSGKLKPNLGNFESEPDWTEILKNYRGSELHGYFTKLLENKITLSTKVQYTDQVPKALKKLLKKDDLTVIESLRARDGRGKVDYYIEKMRLENILDRRLDDLSGGELQRVCIAIACLKSADCYVFDEPTSFLDVKQRLAAAREIRSMAEDDKYVIVVEHDLAILDMMSDYGCILYGMSGMYGVITSPYSIKAAINIFLDGYIPTENMRFRDIGLKFNIQEVEESKSERRNQFEYPAATKTFDGFKLKISPGSFSQSEIIVFLGENGMGKTTFVNLIAGLTQSDEKVGFMGFTVSLKPQKILPKQRGSVRDILNAKIRGSFADQSFLTEVIRPLGIEYLLDQDITSLSGGELQRIAIILCLGQDADIYLLDEPSAFLDSDQRICIAKIIKKYIYKKKKSAFLVEHDLILGTYLADKVIVFQGTPGVDSHASPPMELADGMNLFLKSLDITFRRDPENYRPRINKPDSTKDKEQKGANRYFFT